MSNKSKVDIPPLEPKLMSFFSIDRNEGAYRILEVSIDINSNTIYAAKKPSEPEILSIAFSQLQRKLREVLGL